MTLALRRTAFHDGRAASIATAPAVMAVVADFVIVQPSYGPRGAGQTSVLLLCCQSFRNPVRVQAVRTLPRPPERRLGLVETIGHAAVWAVRRRALLDHLVRAQQNRRGYGKTERLGGPPVHDHLKLGRKLHREVRAADPGGNGHRRLAQALDGV